MHRYLSCLFIVILIFTPITVDSSVKQHMEVHFIDVGQGDSILIETPEDKTILIDGGPPESEKKLISYLKENDVKQIDLLSATHPDYDHIGGLVKVMKTFKVKQILDSGKIHLTKAFANYVNEIRKQEIPTTIAKFNQQIKIDPRIDIKVLNAHRKEYNNNESSIALMVTYNEIDFLLASDIEMKQEERIMEKENIEADILKVAHHGSDSSTSFPFLYDVDPEVAILTYSEDNDFGHPVERVIENLDRIDALVYSTAVYGDIVITTNGKDYLVLPDKDPRNNMFHQSA